FAAREDKLLPGKERYRDIAGKRGGANLRTGQVEQDTQRLIEVLTDLAKVFDYARNGGMIGMRTVDASDIHPGFDQLFQHRAFAGCRSNGGDNFSSTHRSKVHQMPELAKGTGGVFEEISTPTIGASSPKPAPALDI